MSHSHWPTREPFTLLAQTRRCNLPKAECDALWSAYQHHHEGQACVKRVEPGNAQATCVLRPGASERGMKAGRWGE